MRYFRTTCFVFLTIAYECCYAELHGEVTGITSGRNSTQEDATISLFETLLVDYDKSIRPYFATGLPVDVIVDIYLASLDSIRENQMEYGLSIYLRLKWHDPRLEFNSSIYLPPTSDLVDKIWLPDLVIGNAKKAKFHNITVPNRWVKISSNGNVYYTARLSLLLSCPMDFHYFPLDDQQCAMDLDSFEYPIADVVYAWNDTDPVEFYPELLKLPQYVLRGVHVSNNCTKTMRTGIYSCVAIEFLFHRQIGFYMLQSYIPSTLLVLTSWVSFWLQIYGSSARVGIGVTTILSTMTLYNGVRSDISHVSYIKALDVWFGVCFAFVVGALLEYALVHYLSFNKVKFPRPFLSFKERSRKFMYEPCFIMTIFDSPKIVPDQEKPSKITTQSSDLKAFSSKYSNGYVNKDSKGAYTNPINCMEEESGLDTDRESALDTNDSQFVKHHESDTEAIPTRKSIRSNHSRQICVKGKCNDYTKNFDLRFGIGKTIDRVCRILFPTLFVAFNAGYWEYYVVIAERPTYNF